MARHLSTPLLAATLLLLLAAATVSAQSVSAGITVNRNFLFGSRCTNKATCAGCATERVRLGFCINNRTLTYMGATTCALIENYTSGSSCVGTSSAKSFVPCTRCVPSLNATANCGTQSMNFTAASDGNCTRAVATVPGPSTTCSAQGVVYRGVRSCSIFRVDEYYDSGCTVFKRTEDVVAGGPGICNNGVVIRSDAISSAASMSVAAAGFVALAAMLLFA